MRTIKVMVSEEKWREMSIPAHLPEDRDREVLILGAKVFGAIACDETEVMIGEVGSVESEKSPYTEILRVVGDIATALRKLEQNSGVLLEILKVGKALEEKRGS